VRNKVSFQQSPHDLILNPYAESGLAALRKPDFLWRPRPKASIHGFAASEHTEINQRIAALLKLTERHRAFKQAIEFNTIPVLLEDVWFKKSFVTSQDFCLISGASGVRLLAHYCWKTEGLGFDPEQALVDYFHSCQRENAGKTLPVVTQPPPAETGFAIDCRNTFNFYHFVVESLSQLCLVAETGLTGPIYFHFPNTEDKTRPFVLGFIEALFPELADRVVFQRAPCHHPSVVYPYNFGPSYYQMPEVESAGLDDFAPSDLAWEGRSASRNSQGMLVMNSVDSSLYKLRGRALRAIEGKDFSHLPRRFWIGREAEQARNRDMKGEAELLEMLQLFGFEQLTFESLSPLEQIGLMANAEMMVSYHGAGFANMLFANPKATVIELGTLQTATTRWGDFWRCANVSQCRYVSFFADYNSETPLVDPVFTQDSIVPVHLSKAGLAQVMGFVVALLGKLPELKRPEDIHRLAAQLVEVGEAAQARDLLEMHAAVIAGDLDCQLSLAAACEALEDRPAQLSALYAAYRIEPSRWLTLVSVIWCARALDDLDTVHAALEVFREGFPEAFDGFAKDRPWIKAQLQRLPRRAAR
jgi:hypothetical protein